MEEEKKENEEEPKAEEKQEELAETEIEEEEDIEEEIAETTEETLEKEEPMKETVETKEEIPTVPEEKEEKPAPKEKLEGEIVEERIYTISLGKSWIMPPKKRAPKAMRIIKNFVAKHMKLETPKEAEEEPKKLIISNEVNERVWRRGIEKPPRKIRIRAAKDKEGNITVYLAEGD